MSSRPRAWTFYVDDMIHSIQRIQSICSRHTQESFAGDEDSVDLVTHHFEILGEASRHIPAAVVANHPELPWRVMRDT